MAWKNPLTSYICAEQEAQPRAWNNENVLGTLGYETAVFILPHNHVVWSNRLQTGVWETFLSNTYSFKHKGPPLCEATRTSFAGAQMYFCKANLQTDLNGKIRIKWGSAKSQFVFPSPQRWLTAKKKYVATVCFQQTEMFWFWDGLHPLQTDLKKHDQQLIYELNAFKNPFNDLSMSTKHHKFLKK